jgi:hypothetical protein
MFLSLTLSNKFRPGDVNASKQVQSALPWKWLKKHGTNLGHID